MRYLPLMLLAVTLPAGAELHFDELQAKRSEWETYRFPVLKGDGNAVQRINTYLQASVLEGLPGRFERSPFERIWPKDGEIWGTNSIDYAIDGQGPGYLSLSLTSEYTGAYTSMGTFTYQFDLASGQPIALAQLFSEVGLKKLGERMGRERGKRIKDFLAALPPPDEASTAPDDDDHVEIQRSMYEECLPRRSQGELQYDRVQLGDDSLTLIAESCAAHAVRALDDLGDYPNSLPYVELADDLSAYGRCLLLEQRDNCQRPADLRAGGTYQGKIDGRYAITLVLKGGVFSSSSYFYDRYAKRIELSQQDAGAEHVRLREDGDAAALFDLRLQPDGSLRGTWQQDGGKALAVELR